MTGEELLWRPFESPERYEREKATRLMPDAIEVGALLTLRIRWPEWGRPASSPDEFGREFAVLIQDVSRTDEPWWTVDYAWKAREHVDLMQFPVSDDGFVVALEDGEVVDEMGYFVGSLDPYDLALGDLTQRLAVPV